MTERSMITGNTFGNAVLMSVVLTLGGSIASLSWSDLSPVIGVVTVVVLVRLPTLMDEGFFIPALLVVGGFTILYMVTLGLTPTIFWALTSVVGGTGCALMHPSRIGDRAGGE